MISRSTLTKAKKKLEAAGLKKTTKSTWAKSSKPKVRDAAGKARLAEQKRKARAKRKGKKKPFANLLGTAVKTKRRYGEASKVKG